MPTIPNAAITEQLHSIRAEINAAADIAPENRGYARGRLHQLLILDLITQEQYEELHSLLNPAKCSTVPH